MTLKNNKTTIVVALFVATLVLASYSSLSNANAQTPIQNGSASSKYDSKYYLSQYNAIHTQVLQLRNDVSTLENQMHTISTQSGSAVTNQMTQIQQQIDSKNSQINTLSDQLDQIQAKSQALFVVDPQTKTKLYSAEKLLIDRYMNQRSASYIGPNAVGILFADLENKTIVVVLDPDQTIKKVNGAQVITNIVNDMKKITGDIPIDVQYGKTETISCSSRTSNCNPVIGGISISQTGQSSSQSSTLGYYAKDLSSNPGFVIAGHAAGFNGQTIVQAGGTSNSVGTVTAYCYTTLGPYACDFAFVKASGVTVSNSIYQSSGVTESITSRTTGSNQSPGTTVTYSGLTSGIVTGTTISSSPSSVYKIVQANIAVGDSGSPVYVDGGSSANLYGMAFLKSGSYYLYYPYDYIEGQLSITH